MAENLSESNSDGGICSVFDTYPYVIVATVSSGSAMVSALCCLFVIGLIFFLKKHYFFTQRLILYHCLAALLRSFSTILRLHRLGYQTETSALEIICIFSALTNQVTLWVLTVDYSVITFTLLMAAVFQKNVARLEGLFIVLIFAFPLIFNWIPFIDDTYGRFGPWCWIRSMNYSDCSQHHFGIILQYVMWQVPFVVIMIILIPMYLVTIAYVAKRKCSQTEKNVINNSETERLKKKLRNEVWWPLLFLPLGVLFLNFFPLVRALYDAVNPNNPSYTIWLLSVIFSPLQGGYIALVYVLDRYTLKRITLSNIKATLSRRKTVTEYPMENGGISDSVVISEYTQRTHYRPYGDTAI